MIFYPINIELKFFKLWREFLKKLIAGIKSIYWRDDIIFTQKEIEQYFEKEYFNIQQQLPFLFSEIVAFSKSTFYKKLMKVINKNRFLREKYTIEALKIKLNDIDTSKYLEEFIYKNNIYKEQLKNELLQRTLPITSRAIEKGESIKTISNSLQEVYGWAESKASLHASTQTANILGVINRQRFLANGLKHYIWSTSRDNRVRPSHRALEGTKRKWGEGLEPGQDFRCRCVALPVEEEVISILNA
jgi:SPP1 gp7 family putative phage head morphogenesis protein